MESRANVFYGILLPRLQELMTNKHIGVLNSGLGGVGEAKVLVLFQRMLSVVLLGQSADMILQNRAMLKSNGNRSRFPTSSKHLGLGSLDSQEFQNDPNPL